MVTDLYMQHNEGTKNERHEIRIFMKICVITHKMKNKYIT